MARGKQGKRLVRMTLLTYTDASLRELRRGPLLQLRLHLTTDPLAEGPRAPVQDIPIMEVLDAEPVPLPTKAEKKSSHARGKKAPDAPAD